MNNENDDLKEKAEENAKILSEKIDELEDSGWENGKITYKEFWDKAREITDLFKEIKPLTRSDREELWSRYDEICNEVKNAQKQLFESRKAHSAKLSDFILAQIIDADLKVYAAKDIEELRKTDEFINTILDWMRGGSSVINRTLLKEFSIPQEVKLTHEDNEECWNNWKELKEKSKSKKESFYESNYTQFLKKAEKAFNLAGTLSILEAKNKIRELQSELSGTALSGDKFKEIKDILKSAWNKISERAAQIPHESIVSEYDKLSRLTDLLQKNITIIENLKAQINECKVMEKDATSYEFALKVRGWIEEKVEKIHSIKETNLTLEEKIKQLKNSKN